MKFITFTTNYFDSNRSTLMQLAMVLAVLVSAPLIGLFAARIPMLFFIVISLPIILLFVNYVLLRPEVWPLIILIAAAFSPITLPTGRESRIVDSLLLTVLLTGHWIFKIITVEKRWGFKPTPMNKPLFIFMGIVVFSLMWSFFFRDPLVHIWKSFPFVQGASALSMIMLPAAFLLTANGINNQKPLKIMVGIMLLAGVIAGITIFAELPIPQIAKVNDGGLFSMWIVGLSIGLALFVRKMPWYAKVALLILGGLWLYVRFFLGVTWLAGWLPSMIVFGILVFRRSKKLLIIIALIGLIYIALNANYYLGDVLEAENEGSGVTRMAAWEVNWRVTGKHLLFGTGPAGYAAYYMSYYPVEGMATHNNILDILAQSGVFALASVLWFFGVLIWVGYKLCLRLNGQGSFLEAMANVAFAGSIAAFVMMVFGDWLFPFAYTQTITGFDYVVYSWLFMGFIPVIDHLTVDSTKTVEFNGK